MQTLHHVLYKTTCTITGDFYIGVHSTNFLEDEYLGSGMRLRYSIQKYGRNSHVREILESFETREELMNRERKIVNEEMLKNPKCLNLKIGGDGGFKNEEHKKKFQIVGSRAGNLSKALLRNDPDWVVKNRKAISEGLKNSSKVKSNGNNKRGTKHAEETIQKFRESRSITSKGEKNSQFGTKWMHKGSKNTKVKPEEIESMKMQGWILGRRIQVVA